MLEAEQVADLVGDEVGEVAAELLCAEGLVRDAGGEDEGGVAAVDVALVDVLGDAPQQAEVRFERGAVAADVHDGVRRAVDRSRAGDRDAERREHRRQLGLECGQDHRFLAVEADGGDERGDVDVVDLDRSVERDVGRAVGVEHDDLPSRTHRQRGCSGRLRHLGRRFDDLDDLDDRHRVFGGGGLGYLDRRRLGVAVAGTHDREGLGRLRLVGDRDVRVLDDGGVCRVVLDACFDLGGDRLFGAVDGQVGVVIYRREHLSRRQHLDHHAVSVLEPEHVAEFVSEHADEVDAVDGERRARQRPPPPGGIEIDGDRAVERLRELHVGKIGEHRRDVGQRLGSGTGVDPLLQCDVEGARRRQRR